MDPVKAVVFSVSLSPWCWCLKFFRLFLEPRLVELRGGRCPVVWAAGGTSGITGGTTAAVSVGLAILLVKMDQILCYSADFISVLSSDVDLSGSDLDDDA